MGSGNKDVPVLSGIRGWAALTVFASHSSNIFYSGKWVGAGGGQIGVMLFFMLSGYLMSMLYISSEASSENIGHFFVSRFARVYPLFAFVVLGNYAIANTGAGIATYGIAHADDVLKHLFLVTGYGPLWTIGPEIIFYGIFAALWTVRFRSRETYFIILFLLFFVGMWPGNSERTNSLLILHQRVPYFIVGMLLGTKHDRIQALHLSMSHATKRSIACLMPIIYLACFPNLAAMVHPLPAEMGPDPSLTMWSYPFYLFAMAFLLVGSMIVTPRILTNRVALFMGQVSFPFYLIHEMVLINITPYFTGHPLRAISLSIVLTTIASYALHRIVEMPCRTLIRRVSWRRWQRTGSEQFTA